MTELIRGGRATPIEPGIIARFGQRLRATLDVWFGPLLPMPPVAPPDTAPRRFDYPSGVNLVTLPRSYETISFQQMRDLADSLDLVRIAIETRKDQVSKMPWSFREKRQSAVGTRHSASQRDGSLTDVGRSAKHLLPHRRSAKLSTAECRMPSAECLVQDLDRSTKRLPPHRHNPKLATADCRMPSAECLVQRIDELNRFFESPDGEHNFDDWLRMILEDLLVIDAVTLAATVDDHGTVWSEDKQVRRFEVIDGATIKRVIDDMGRTPSSPAVAYQQILKGLPAIDFTADELVYRPRNLRAHKFYGYSPVEQISITINLALRRQMYMLAYFTDGNVPEAIVQAPEIWNMDTVKEFQDSFDHMLSGNLAQRHKIIFIPNAGGKDAIQFTKEPPLANDIDEWLARVVCWAFSISPQALIKQMNRATAETAKEQSEEEGITPLLNWLASLINSLVRKYFGYDDVEFAWGQRQDENKLEQAQINQIYVQSGILTVDEVRESLGRERLGVRQSAVGVRP